MIANMATVRIGKGRRPHHYIVEHMEAKSRNKAYIAGRLEVHRSQITKWLKKGDQISIDEARKFAYALDLEDWTDLLRPPGEKQSNVPEADVDVLIKAVATIAKKMGRG